MVVFNWSARIVKFAISFDLFSKSNENERLPTQAEEELAHVIYKKQKTKTKTLSRVQNLAEGKCNVADRTHGLPNTGRALSTELREHSDIRKYTFRTFIYFC